MPNSHIHLQNPSECVVSIPVRCNLIYHRICPASNFCQDTGIKVGHNHPPQAHLFPRGKAMRLVLIGYPGATLLKLLLHKRNNLRPKMEEYGLRLTSMVIWCSGVCAWWYGWNVTVQVKDNWSRPSPRHPADFKSHWRGRSLEVASVSFANDQDCCIKFKYRIKLEGTIILIISITVIISITISTKFLV